MDYRKKGDEELDLNKDDLLRVFKRYNHWSYVSFSNMQSCRTMFLLLSQAVKEDGGDRGWVPVSGSSMLSPDLSNRNYPQSWFIGKVTASGPVPATPNTGMSAHGLMSEELGQNQVSPMSSAFPPQTQIRAI